MAKNKLKEGLDDNSDKNEIIGALTGQLAEVESLFENFREEQKLYVHYGLTSSGVLSELVELKLLLIKAINKYSKIHTENSKKYLVELETELVKVNSAILQTQSGNLTWINN